MTHFGVDADGAFYAPPSAQVRCFHSEAELDRFLANGFPNAPAEATISEKIDADYEETA